MRKQVTAQDGNARTEFAGQGGWLDLDELAQVEVSSEAQGHPVESALVPNSSTFWQAAVLGVACITLRFDEPQSVRRVLLRVTERQQERSQEWALSAVFANGTRRELVRQQWNFSPGGSTEQREDYAFDLKQVTALSLTIDPDRGQDRYPATLAAWRVGTNAITHNAV